MSENTLKARLVHPCKTDAEWASSNPVAKKGEIMISSDKSGMFKVGNGTNKWSDLQYNHVTWVNVEGKPSTFSPSAHKHTKIDITDFPSSMVNPHSIIIKLNGGTTEGSNLFTYNGSSAKSLNITASSIGAASSSHTHSYLPLSGGTVTNNTSFNKDLYVYGETYLNGSNVYINGKTNIQGNGLEIFHSTPYIDFHFNNDSGDQTSRIIEMKKGVLNVNGTCCTSDGSLWCTSFSTDGGGTFGGDLSATRGLKLNHNGTSLYVYNESGTFCIMHTGTDGKSSWPILWNFASNSLAVSNALYCSSTGTFDKGITSKAESVFHTGSYTDPYPGKTCTIKSWGTVASLRFAAKGISNTWLGAAKPDGAAYDTINTEANALVPGWRVRTADGAWVGASYAQDPGFRIYYCNASRLSGSSNGYDAVFTFGQSGTMYASSFSQTSDERRKNVITNLSTLPQAHKDFFMKLNPFTFKWKKEEDKQSHYGVGAQSVYQAALDCGFTDDDLGFIHKGKELPGTSIPWSVSYTEFIPLNIAVTQDHETRIEKLERENEELKQQIKELKGLTA